MPDAQYIKLLCWDFEFVLACVQACENAASTADGVASLPKPFKATRHYKPGKQGFTMKKNQIIQPFSIYSSNRVSGGFNSVIVTSTIYRTL